MTWKTLLTATLLTLASAAAHSAPKPLLSGTTAGLPWSVAATGPSSASLQEDGGPLRLSAPPGASVLGTKYDPAAGTARLTYRYRGGMDARSALAFAANQLQLQGFDVTARTYPEASRARATLNRDAQRLEVQTLRRANGDLEVLYVFGDTVP